MRVAALTCVALSFPACSVGPNTEQLAKQCGVSAAELDRAKSNAKSLRPYASVEVGKCSIIKDDSEVEVITPETKARVEAMIKGERQAALNGIADRCGAPRSAWKLIDADHVSLQPVVDPSDERASCLINELFKSRLPVKLGFISEPPPETNR